MPDPQAPRNAAAVAPLQKELDDLNGRIATLEQQATTLAKQAEGDAYDPATKAARDQHARVQSQIAQLVGHRATVSGQIAQLQRDPAGQPPGADPNAPKPGTVAAQTSANANQTRAEATSAYDQAREAYLNNQITRQNLATEAQIYNQRLNTQVALGQLTRQDADQQLNQWKAGIEAAQNERRIAVEQQNANTSAGNLGVSRGSLGVSQENADTAREQVVQTAAQNAVQNTLKLLERYMPLSGGADDGFLKNYTAGMNKMGGSNFQPSDFVTKAPDLAAVSQQAAQAAIQHMKTNSAPAPATVAATSATAVPTAPTPAAVPPQPAYAPQPTAASILAAAGPPPAAPAALPAYTGPTANNPGGQISVAPATAQ